MPHRPEVHRWYCTAGWQRRRAHQLMIGPLCRLCLEADADDVVVEINFGGDMATEVVKQAAERVHQRGERESNLIRVKEVSASRGKAMRAEPISLLYEKGRVLHRHGLDQLEGEMMAFSREWDRAVDGSPPLRRRPRGAGIASSAWSCR